VIPATRPRASPRRRLSLSGLRLCRLLVHFQSLPKLFQFSRSQVSPCATRDSLQHYRPEPNPLQPQHRISDPLHHAPNYSVSSLMDHQAKHRSARLIADCPYVIGSHDLSVDRYASLQPLEIRARRVAIQEDLIFFVEFVTRMGDAKGQFAIVRQQQQTAGRSVKPSNWYDPLRHVNEIHHRSAPPLVAGGRDVPRRLVEHDVARAFLYDEAAVDPNFLFLWINAKSLGSYNFAIHRNAAVGDHLFSFAPGRYSPRCQHFVQAFHLFVLPERLVRYSVRTRTLDGSVIR
jgi:hypothetical protein